MTAQVSEELLAEFADVMSVVQMDTPGSLYTMLKETFRQTGMILAMKAAEPLAQGDEQWLIDELENGITNLKKALRETKRDDFFWNRYWDGYLKGYESLLAMATDRAALVRSKPIDREKVARAISGAAYDYMRSIGFSGGWDHDELGNTIADAAITAIGSQSIEGERVRPEAELYAKYLEEAPDMPFHTWATQPKCDCGQSSNGSQGAHHPQCPRMGA